MLPTVASISPSLLNRRSENARSVPFLSTLTNLSEGNSMYTLGAPPGCRSPTAKFPVGCTVIAPMPPASMPTRNVCSLVSRSNMSTDVPDDVSSLVSPRRCKLLRFCVSHPYECLSSMLYGRNPRPGRPRSNRNFVGSSSFFFCFGAGAATCCASAPGASSSAAPCCAVFASPPPAGSADSTGPSPSIGASSRPSSGGTSPPSSASPAPPSAI
eukprot:00187_2